MIASSTPTMVRIAEVYEDGQDARHFRLEALEPDRLAPASPGQFFMLALPGLGEAAFTYVTSPDGAGRFDALIRRVGLLTSELFALGVGSHLGLRGPFGRGWPLPELQGHRVLVLAGGCGLAPLCSALRALSGDTTTRLAVVYGSRNAAAQVLSRERAALAARMPWIETFDAPADGAQRRGTPMAHLDLAVAALGGEPERALLCGPQVMMERGARALLDRGLPAQRIWLSIERRMHCGVGLCGHCYVAHTYACTQGPTYRWDELLELSALSPRRPAAATEVHHC